MGEEEQQQQHTILFLPYVFNHKPIKQTEWQRNYLKHTINIKQEYIKRETSPNVSSLV